MKRIIYSGFFIALLVAVAITAGAQATQASYSGLVAGWLPWWAVGTGIPDVAAHMNDINILYPFIYQVHTDGSLEPMTDTSLSQWQNLFALARAHSVSVIPTITWIDGNAIDMVLGNVATRHQQESAITTMVQQGNYAGVNIDYEGKLAQTMNNYSLFLKELKQSLGSKSLTCTIEARTPVADLYATVPTTTPEYANDYRAINQYCDQVEIMAYDQQRVDVTLNAANKGYPYVPVADQAWVDKVVALAVKDINPDKILLGIPTYGRVWHVTVAPQWYKDYTPVTSINVANAHTLAAQYNVTPARNAAGEVSFTYFPTDSVFNVLNQLPTPVGTKPGFEAAAKALLFANETGMTVPVNVAWYSDATSTAAKLSIAAKYHLKGSAIFKFDGLEDSAIWNVL